MRNRESGDISREYGNTICSDLSEGNRASTDPSRVKLSIIIKSLNEEKKIGACLKAAIQEAALWDGEVILVDSLSTDRTLEIAMASKVTKIVQFSNATDSNCGAAVQLGYQFAKGEFIYVLDGDMVLQPGFLAKAMEMLDSDPLLAGVGGKILDTQINTADDLRRISTAESHNAAMYVHELGGGGLYLRKAIESVGYMGHRWLPACEEMELGARLIAAGWKLIRIPRTAVTHTGHNESNFQMLVRKWKRRNAHAFGMVIRASLGKPWGHMIRKKNWFVSIVPALHIAALALGVALAAFNVFDLAFLWPLLLELALWSSIVFIMALVKKSLETGAFSVFSWHWITLAALIGAAQPLPAPSIKISAKIIR